MEVNGQHHDSAALFPGRNPCTGWRLGRGLMLATYPHVAPTLRMGGALPPHSPLCLHVVDRDKFTLTLAFMFFLTSLCVSTMRATCTIIVRKQLCADVDWPSQCCRKTAWSLACDFVNGRQIKEEVWQGRGGLDCDLKQPADRMLPPSCSPLDSVQLLLTAARTSDPVSGPTLLFFRA